METRPSAAAQEGQPDADWEPVIAIRSHPTTVRKPVMRSRTSSAARMRGNLTSRSVSNLHPSQHPANTSSSKQMFSFGVGDRFMKPNKVLNHSIGYDMRSSLGDKGVTFGIGPRTPNMVKKNFDKFPEPGSYKLPSDFEKPNTSYNAGKQFSFGASRDAYDRVYYKERIPHDRSLPGPGHYNQEARTIVKNSNQSFSILGRIPSESQFCIKVKTPGPGTYREQEELSKEGRYVKSTNKNSCVPTFKRPLGVASGHTSERKVRQGDPGPGTYTPRETSNTNRYRNVQNLQLHKGERKIELHDKTKLDLPGPQHYILPSDFGNSHLASTTSFGVIPQINNTNLTDQNQQRRRRRTRNNGVNNLAATQHSSSLLNLNQSSSATVSGLTQRQQMMQSIASIASKKQVGETGDISLASPAAEETTQASLNQSRRKLVTSQSQAFTKKQLKIKRLSKPSKPGASVVATGEGTEEREKLMKQLKELKAKQGQATIAQPKAKAAEPFKEQTRASQNVPTERPKSGKAHKPSSTAQKQLIQKNSIVFEGLRSEEISVMEPQITVREEAQQVAQGPTESELQVESNQDRNMLQSPNDNQ